MNRTNIEWADATWNPCHGCTPVSPGCAHCYARTVAETRLRGVGTYPKDDPFRVVIDPYKLGDPLHWRKPSRIFPVSMGDWLHEEVPLRYAMAMLGVAGRCERHRFMFLTKREDRLDELGAALAGNPVEAATECFRAALDYLPSGVDQDDIYEARTDLAVYGPASRFTFPFSNVGQGATAEDQSNADRRVQVVLRFPAAVRFVSVEPMLSGVDMTGHLPGDPGAFCESRECAGCREGDDPCDDFKESSRLDWVVCGGESGPGARPMNPQWARDLRDQCKAAGVPFFYKQGPGDHGAKHVKIPVLDGATYNQYPRALGLALEGD